MYPFFEVIPLGSTPKSVLLPWMPTAADNAFLAYEVATSFFESGGSLAVVAYTKNRSDPGSEGTAFSSFAQIGSTGIYEKKCENLKELLRFKITVTPGSGTSEPAVTQGAFMRFLPPNWYDTA